jgi:hypothetical protein
MRFQSALIGCAALTMACSIPTAASAGRRARYQSETPTTILPSRQEVAAVPVPERGRVLAYPVDVFRYGRTIHPGVRAVRRFLAR